MSLVNQFAQIPDVNVSRNEFIRNFNYKTALDGGYLYPVFWDEVVPGDTKKLNTTFFGRLSTPFVPVMDNIYLDYHLFFVPNRLLWNNWQKFMGERINPDDSIDYLVPKITSGETGFSRYGLIDYLGGTPVGVANLTASSLVFYLRAYNLIWNEWYRCEYLQDSVTVPLDDGPDDEAYYNLLKRGKRGDYYTTCLPQPQKGPGVELPLGTTAPVVGNGMTLGLTNNTVNFGLASGVGNNSMYAYSNLYGEDIGSSAGLGISSDGKSFGVTSDPQMSGLVADLSSATSATINSLRQAIAVQQFLERDMRSGTRYVELLYSHYGVVCPDYRLQRPEYLGGSTSMLNISPIAQTSSSDSVSPQGNLSAYATFASSNQGFVRSFTEHGVILGLVSIRTDLNYQQGLDRHFSRNTRYDYLFPTFAHLGEQAVLNKEIYAQGTDEDDEPFGYQERYAEYRFKNSYITGKMRSDDPQSLDIWHLAQNFESLPTLSSDFIEENPPFDRIIAVQDEPQFLLDVHHELTDIRELPLYAIPGLERI